MTNREKAERCGESVRDGLLILADNHKWVPAWQNDPVTLSNSIAEGARQAGHWGRLALAEAGHKVAS